MWFSLFGLSPTFADTPPTTITDTDIETLPTYLVEGKKIENIDIIKEELSRRPASTALIEEKEIKQSRGLNLNDVLQFVPGVRFQSRFGADEGQFQIRGTSLRNNFHHRGITILINGIPFGDADGFSDFESIELLAYERIEVYKGTNALRYGANTIGGAINFVPRTGYNASMLQVRAQGGSFGLYMGQVSSGRVSKPMKLGFMDVIADYYISVSGNHQDGFQDHSQQDRQRLNANFGFKLGTHQEIRAYLLGGNVAERIPGSLTLGQMEANPQQSSSLGGISLFACVPNQVCNYGRFYNLWRAGVAYRNEFSPQQFIEIIPFYSYQYLDHPIFQTIVQDNHNVGAELRYHNSKPLFGHDNAFLIGHQPRYGDQHQRRFSNVLGNRGPQTQNLNTRTTNFGTYIENQFNISDGLVLIIGGRWDYSVRQARNELISPFSGLVTSSRSDLRQFNAITPKAGVVYHTSSTSQIFGNISRGYEPPLNLELTSAINPDGSTPTSAFLSLDAQRAWQFEIGTRGTTANQRFSWDFTVYNLEMEKEILASVIGGTSTFQNANGTRHTGIEAGGSLLVLTGLLAPGTPAQQDRLIVRTAYTWSLFQFTDDVFGGSTLIAADGNRVPGAPEHNLAGELRYDHPSGFWIAPNFEWSIKGFHVDNLNTVKNPAYFVVHMKGGYNIRKNLVIFAEGRNLTNQTYAGAVVVNDNMGRFFNPAPGISGFAGMEWTFN
ncbi:TonB-dependent receptor [Candidatus Nitronereus thalassa]|uniref:TonB-dependent receptor n=1 Tax=Candidatus Nitronereus thalassa TaxID=3020898 RepID=A0ABU3KC09_9BACT|nr:TonB-dependent receptor [Candidatus Nitronereus thalassa]MDT7043921.1 TonB-dependent receptor [Candidatus Nitronereus thalassa]